MQNVQNVSYPEEAQNDKQTTEVLAIYKRITHGNKFIATYSHCQCVCFSLRAVFGAACVTQKSHKRQKSGENERKLVEKSRVFKQYV